MIEEITCIDIEVPVGFGPDYRDCTPNELRFGVILEDYISEPGNIFVANKLPTYSSHTFVSTGAQKRLQEMADEENMTVKQFCAGIFYSCLSQAII